MKNILFVDDNQDTLKELKKILHPMSQEWDMKFTKSANEALELMSKSSFNVIVSGMHMSDMDGPVLLGTIMDRYPETVRVILSTHSDKETVMRLVKSAHQCLSKPFSSETIKYTIERTCKLQDSLRNKALKKLITGIKDLPSIPSLYSLIIEEMQSPDASLKKVGYIISQDVSMSAKILQLVNSAFFGLPRKIVDPQQAAIYLGIDTLKALVLTINVFSSFTEDAEKCDFSMADMWRHSMMTGRLAKDIASTELDEKGVEEEAFIAGILHDIGKLVLLRIPEQYREINDFAENSGCTFVEAEYAVLKTSHAEIGAYLLGLWGLPDNIVETVAFHHNPSKLLEDILKTLKKTPDKGEKKRKSKDSNLSARSGERLLREFITLTAVHMANAMMMQKSRSFSNTVLPYADIQYLRSLNLTDKLAEKVECYNNIIKKVI